MAYIKLLKDVPLDNRYNNPVLFGSSSTLPTGFTKIDYQKFFSKFDTSWLPTHTDLHMNIRVGDGVNTTLIVPEQDYQPAYNYAIIEYEDDEVKPASFSTNPSQFYFYYFITDVKPLGKGNYVLTLELDIMTTYLLYAKLDHPIFTQRKHCNRWRKSGNILEWKDAILSDEIDGSFSAKKVGMIYNNNVFKYVSSGNLTYPADATAINTYFSRTMWCYIFYTRIPLQNLKDADVSSSDIKSLVLTGANGQTYNTGLICVAIPCRSIALYHNGDWIAYYSTSGSLMNSLLTTDGCIGAKMSFRSPFVDTIDYKTGGSLYVTKSSTETYTNPHLNITSTATELTAKSGVLAKCWYKNFGNLTQYFSTSTETGHNNELLEVALCVNSLPKSYFSSDDILVNNTDKTYFETYYINAYKVDKAIGWEPKLLCSPFYNLVLQSQFGGSYNFNPLMLNAQYTNIVVYTEISPEPDKIYCTLSSASSSPYYHLKSVNIGNIIINDNNIPYKQGAYETYLQEHRASSIMGVAVNTGSSAMQLGLGIASLATGQPSTIMKQMGGIGSDIAGGVTGLASSIGGIASNLVDLKNTPDAIKNQGNNPVHDFIMLNDYAPYLVEFELFDNEKQQVFDYFYDNGYRVNRKCTISFTDFTDTEQIITRQKFNYIKISDDITNELKFEVDGASIYVPQIVKQKINQLFNRGFKLWTLIYLDEDDADWQDFYLGSDFENAEIKLPS